MNPNQTEIWTVLRLIEWGASYFKEKRIDSPRLTIELMLAEVLELERFDLYMQFDRPLIEDELGELKTMIKRRIAREPLQYILGKTGFYGRVFVVRPGVLIPRPETELLVEEALRRTRFLRVIDVGTGSGCIAISIALERPDAEVVAIDSSEGALAVARENAALLKAEHVEFHQIDVFDDHQIKNLGTFDLIVSNPPYISPSEMSTLQEEVRDYEPRLALTDEGDGLRFYRRFVEISKTLLRRGGEMFFELGHDQAESVRELFVQAGFEVEVFTDLNKIERILRARDHLEVETPL